MNQLSTTNAQVIDATQNGPDIIVAIPAYNEDRFIGSLVIKLRRHFATVMVIDDGSTDDTAEVARKAGALVFTHQGNLGKGEGINTAFRVARELQAKALVLLDGDGQHRVEDTLAVLRPVLAGESDVVVGSRFLGPGSETPPHRLIGQHVLNGITTMSSGVPLSDSQSGLRAFSQHALAVLAFSSQGFSVESEMQFLIRRDQLRVSEVPITVVYREPDKRNPFRHGMQVVNGIIRLIARQRPLLIFSGGGAVFVLAGLGLGLEVNAIYTRTHDLALGYALITIMLVIVGTVSMFVGLMLNSLTGLISDVEREMKLVSQQVLPSVLLTELERRKKQVVPGEQPAEQPGMRQRMRS